MLFASRSDWGQPPRFFHEPAGVVRSYLEPAAGLAADAGLPLDLWQQFALGLMLGVREDGSWAAFEAAYDVSRQNGKGGILESRELSGLFLFGERRIIHSAHEADTATEAFERMKALINGRTWLWSRVAKINAQPGKQFILLKDGRRLSYRTRTAGGGRGFSAPVLILDEAQELQQREIAAIVPVMSAQPNAQMIYAFTVKQAAAVARGVVERGRAGATSRLAYAEWSAPDDVDSDDRAGWRAANPAMGIRISEEYIADELAMFRAADAEAEWRMERLGIWPAAAALGTLIRVAAWAAIEDDTWAPWPAIPKPYSFGIAVSRDRKHASIGFACERPDGDLYVELIARSGEETFPGSGEHFPEGVDWVLPWVTARLPQHPDLEWVMDQRGPAAALQPALAKARVPVKMTSTAEFHTACIGFVDKIDGAHIHHRGQEILTQSAHAIERRDVGDSWLYDRRSVNADAIEAVTLAAWAVVGGRRPSKYDTEDLLVLGG